MLTDKNIPQNNLILGREFEGCRLTRPNSIFIFMFKTVTEIVFNNIPKIITVFGIKAKLLLRVRESCAADISTLFCDEHANNVEIFITTSVNIIFFHYLKCINKILSGKDIRPSNQDPLTKLALKKYNKKLKFKTN